VCHLAPVCGGRSKVRPSLERLGSIRLAMRDQADIVEIVKAQMIDRDAVRAFLVEYTEMLVGRWDALVTQAEAELRRLT